MGSQVAAEEQKRALQEQLDSSQEALRTSEASLAAALSKEQQLQESLRNRKAAEEQLWGRINNLVAERADVEQTIAGLRASLRGNEVTAYHVVLSLPSTGLLCYGQWLHVYLHGL